MHELIDDTSGVLAHDLNSAVDAVGVAVALDRASVRRSAIQRFSAASMVSKYEALYQSIVS
jgi:hypothetical protein